MGKRIFNFFISISLCLLIALPVSAQYSNNYDQRPVATKKKEKKEAEVEYPFYNGTSIGIDLWGPGSKLFGSDFFSAEASAIVDLKHRFFPTIELGYGKTDVWSDDEDINYKSDAPYLRIGGDYNVLYKKAHGHMLLVGLRYGISSTSYDVSSSSIEDPIYGGEIPAFSHTGMKSTMQWMEFVLGVRAKIFKSLYMGWSIRMRYKLAATTGKYGDPYYVPGFGKYDSNCIGVNYSIVYKLPF